MSSALAPRLVLVHRRTELTELVERHGTRGQAEFFLSSRGRSLEQVQQRHDAIESAIQTVAASVPSDWRRGTVERADLDRFSFDDGDVVVVVGQDGLVANAAKYCAGCPVIGVDPEPGVNRGVLLPHRADKHIGSLIRAAAGGRARTQRWAMVRATLDDGQALDALNEVFVGHPSHQSARYRIVLDVAGGDPDRCPVEERQSSSGLIVTTGTGATGWAASVNRDRRTPVELPAPAEQALAWFVREAWPSPSTGVSLTGGLLSGSEELSLVVESDGLAVFGDGVEADRLTATWGQRVRVGVSPKVLTLVT